MLIASRIIVALVYSASFSLWPYVLGTSYFKFLLGLLLGAVFYQVFFHNTVLEKSNSKRVGFFRRIADEVFGYILFPLILVAAFYAKGLGLVFSIILLFLGTLYSYFSIKSLNR